jgi:hypothetical protein
MVAGAWSRRGSSRTSCSLAAHGTKQNKTEETVVSACCEKNRLQSSQSLHRDSCTWTHMSVWWIRIRCGCLYCTWLSFVLTDRRVPTTQQPVDTTRCLLISHCY